MKIAQIIIICVLSIFAFISVLWAIAATTAAARTKEIIEAISLVLMLLAASISLIAE